MINRYSRDEMAQIWTEENKFAAWLEVEILAAEAWSELGVVPKEDCVALRKNARFDVDRIYEIEKQTRHDVVAFTRTVSESLGEEKKWVHYGLTSTDVVDTAYGYLLKQANDILKKDLEHLKDVIGKKAKEYKYTVEMGRTHGVHAEPTTFGLKLLNWYSEMKRNIERFEHASKAVEAGKISGAVGTFANTPPAVEAYVCEHLGIRAQEVSTQVLPRDLHAEYLAVMALIATSVERFATEIRGLQKTEQREVEEYFAAGQKGSSAMPHKRNPIGSENMCGCARVLRGYMHTAYENVALWHERDISHSSVERLIMPDSTILTDYVLHRLCRLLEGLRIMPENMARNLECSFGLYFSQRVLTALIETGIPRQEAYVMVQRNAMKSWETRQPFPELIKADPEINSRLSEETFAGLFDPQFYLRHEGDILKRVFEE